MVTVKHQWTTVHQSVHLFAGFNVDWLGQSNASANSGMFRTTPFTLKTQHWHTTDLTTWALTQRNHPLSGPNTLTSDLLDPKSGRRQYASKYQIWWAIVKLIWAVVWKVIRREMEPVTSRVLVCGLRLKVWIVSTMKADVICLQQTHVHVNCTCLPFQSVDSM